MTQQREPMTEKEQLRFLKIAADIVGAMPPGDLGTQEPAYEAYKILCDEVERLEKRVSAPVTETTDLGKP